jgi:hypothetical protein
MAGYHPSMVDVRVRDLTAHGVRLIPPTDPTFDGIGRPLIGERVADSVLRMKPMLVIVSNESEQTIASFSIVWTTRYEDGLADTTWTHASFPSAISGLDTIKPDEEAIRPGDRRIEGKGIVVHGYGRLDPYYDQFIEQFVPRRSHNLDRVREREIELNAVIFKDGTLAGPDDQSQLRDLFSTYASAHLGWLRGIRQALDAGQTVADAFGAVERFQRGLSDPRDFFHNYHDDPEHFWRVQTSGDVMSWRSRHTDADIPALVRNLNLEPLLVRAI